MNSPSVRDLELLNPTTPGGRGELRTVLEDQFQVEPLVVDWVLYSFANLEIRIRDLQKELKATEMNKLEIELPKGYRIYPEGEGGARFETPTTFGWAKSVEIALEEINKEIQTGNPAWKCSFSPTSVDSVLPS
jgi:hypothetical protein